MTAFTPENLPVAVTALLEENGYEVESSREIHGAEIDLLAKSKVDPFSPMLYIECTVEYVNNEKYGKDTTKFLMVKRHDPEARCIIVSSKGFSAPVFERANAAGVTPLTYDELFAKFQRFDPYIEHILGEGDWGKDLNKLDSIYEEPFFEDHTGSDSAVPFLTQWRDDLNPKRRWIVVVGEYGTGKTALTKILLRRWTQEHKINPSLPLPLWIPLAQFTRQFDSRSLLHRFLDDNDLGHIQVDFLESLIHKGRVVLLLDGYDEMAQYLNTRERRTCLEALAALSEGGAKGILTSRPNYFTEAEELNVVEMMYKSLEARRITVGPVSDKLLDEERQVDELVTKYVLERYERTLRDLDEEQTHSLIDRVLADSPDEKRLVNDLLARIFRSIDGGAEVSLSGKPVIISYLLEVASELQDSETTRDGRLTEWEIFSLIADKLMARDWGRSKIITPGDRLAFLTSLAIKLTKRSEPGVEEEDFRDFVCKFFNRRIKRLPSDAQREEIESLFADLRSSAMLTRGRSHSGKWQFSHNSLREYLSAKFLIEGLRTKTINDDGIVVSDAMRQFAGSIGNAQIKRVRNELAAAWQNRDNNASGGAVFTLLIDAVASLFSHNYDPFGMAMRSIAGDPISLSGVTLSRIDFRYKNAPAILKAANFNGSSFALCNFTECDCEQADFSEAYLEACSFEAATLEDAKFNNAIIFQTRFNDSILNGANFGHFDKDSSIFVEQREMVGVEAAGWLVSKGALVEDVPPYYVLMHRKSFDVAEKIMRKILEGGLRQRRGLTQRGAAHGNPEFARNFLDFAIKSDFVSVPKGRNDLVQITETGRKVFGRFLEAHEVDESLSTFLDENA